MAGLDGVNDLNTLNTILNKSYKKDEGGYLGAVKATWANRRFNLVGEGDAHYDNIKMKDIVDKFKELRKNDLGNTKAIEEIHHQIIELDLEGDKQLSQKGLGSMAIRDVKNFLTRAESHIKTIDEIEQANIHRGSKEGMDIAKYIASRFQSEGVSSLAFRTAIFNFANDEKMLRALAIIDPQAALAMIEGLEKREGREKKEDDAIKNLCATLRQEIAARVPALRQATVEDKIDLNPSEKELLKKLNSGRFENIIRPNMGLESEMKVYRQLGRENPKTALEAINALKEALEGVVEEKEGTRVEKREPNEAVSTWKATKGEAKMYLKQFNLLEQEILHHHPELRHELRPKWKLI